MRAPSKKPTSKSAGCTMAAVAACFGLYAAARYIERGVRQLAASYRERLASM